MTLKQAFTWLVQGIEILTQHTTFLHSLFILNIDVEQLFTGTSWSEFEELSIFSEKHTFNFSISFALDNLVNWAYIFASKGYLGICYFEQIRGSVRCSSYKVKLCLSGGC